MKTLTTSIIVFLALMGGSEAGAAATWVEGKHYFLVDTVPRTSVPPGKVEVTEVFSYGCPACASFNPIAHKLRQSLPGAQLVYVPASFNAAEDWPMFQRAFCTAQVLGIADKAHDAMFDAVWTSQELGVIDPVTQRPKSKLPSIEDAARLYSRVTGVKAEDFIAASKSFSVDVKIRTAEDYIRAYRVVSTPTIIVNGKYRLDGQSAGGYDQLLELVKWLVAKESK